MTWASGQVTSLAHSATLGVRSRALAGRRRIGRRTSRRRRHRLVDRRGSLRGVVAEERAQALAELARGDRLPAQLAAEHRAELGGDLVPGDRDAGEREPAGDLVLHRAHGRGGDVGGGDPPHRRLRRQRVGDDAVTHEALGRPGRAEVLQVRGRQQHRDPRHVGGRGGHAGVEERHAGPLSRCRPAGVQHKVPDARGLDRARGVVCHGEGALVVDDRQVQHDGVGAGVGGLQ